MTKILKLLTNYGMTRWNKEYFVDRENFFQKYECALNILEQHKDAIYSLDTLTMYSRMCYILDKKI